MKEQIIGTLNFLAHDLRQNQLDEIPRPVLSALGSQFRHWAVACDEAAKRPTRRAKATSPATSSPREPARDTDTVFTLAMRSVA